MVGESALWSSSVGGRTDVAFYFGGEGSRGRLGSAVLFLVGRIHGDIWLFPMRLHRQHLYFLSAEIFAFVYQYFASYVCI